MMQKSGSLRRGIGWFDTGGLLENTRALLTLVNLVRICSVCWSRQEGYKESKKQHSNVTYEKERS